MSRVGLHASDYGFRVAGAVAHDDPFRIADAYRGPGPCSHAAMLSFSFGGGGLAMIATLTRIDQSQSRSHAVSRAPAYPTTASTPV